jgi:hypothetical protein
MKDDPAEAAPKPILSVARDASYLTRSAVGPKSEELGLSKCLPGYLRERTLQQWRRNLAAFPVAVMLERHANRLAPAMTEPGPDTAIREVLL